MIPLCFAALALSWTDLSAKRESLPGFHQEFEVSQRTTGAADRDFHRTVALDVTAGKWREESRWGSGRHVRLFDGSALYAFDEGDNEFVRIRKAQPEPVPYSLLSDVDWTKAVERKRAPCASHECVLLEAPLRRIRGSASVFVDPLTGLALSVQVVQFLDGGYRVAHNYTLKSYSLQASSIQLPAGLKEVRELTGWDAPRIHRELSGKPAPSLSVKDITGRPLSLADFRGKTVLLDFWTTWCPPCHADAAILDTMTGADVVVIGISVSEDRAVVEKFLKDRPHTFPIVLSSEHELPRPYQVGIFPTYIVIDPEGRVATAAQGVQGPTELKRLLKRGGLEAR